VYDANPAVTCESLSAATRIRSQELPVPDATSAEPQDHLELFAGIADVLAGGGDVDATLASLLNSGIAATGADSGAIYLQDPDRTELEPAVAVGVGEPVFDRLRTSVGGADDPVATTALERSPLDIRPDSTLRGGFVADTVSAAAAFRPLVVTRGGIELSLGVLALGWRTDRELDPSHERLIGAIANLAAIAIDHGRLGSLVAERSEWFERMAHSDPLTGLANQRTLGRVLELEVARAGRQGGQVSVALFDIDDFRATNESGGHQAGDDVLRSVAAVLSESVRLVDTVARYGGDEFVLVAPGTAGGSVARRVMAGVAALPAVEGRQPSVCAGVVQFPRDGGTGDELIEAAARATAEAKAKGPGSLIETAAERTT
jgi:diguanylate cyclase (GGDEF)-like protein